MRTLLLGLLAVIVVSGCEEKIRPAVVPVTEVDSPSQESWNSTVVFSDSAKVKAVLWAGHIASYASQEYTVLDFYNDEEQHTSLLTARTGRVNDRTRDFAAYVNVVVTSDSGTVLKTDSLFWTNARRQIYTDAFVEIISSTEHIKGRGLVSDQSLKNYHLTHVSGEAVTKD
jgi:LPS export ABC transporter protein LptC